MQKAETGKPQTVRVLHLVSNLCIRNGIMSFLMNYYRHVDRTKVQFGFLYFDEREETYETEILDLGGEIIKIPRPTQIMQFHARCNAIKDSIYGRYEILQLHEPFLISFFSKCKRLWGIEKIIVHAHSVRFSDSKLGEIRNRLLSVGNSFIPDHYFACSEIAGRNLFGGKFAKQGVVISNAIDLNKFYPDEALGRQVREELGVADKFVVGHVGNFAEPKNHPFMIAVFQKLCALREDAVLILVGEGERKQMIRQLCEELGVADKVLFLGVRKDVNRLLCGMDCFLFPSLYEGLGIALVEAQAAGTPCVYSHVLPAETAVLKENNKILSLQEDANVWAKAIAEVQRPDPAGVREKMIAANFCVQEEAAKLQQRYIQMLNRGE